MAITQEDMGAAWGRENVIRYSVVDLDGLGLPAHSQQTLLEYGLPSRVERLFSVAPLARIELKSMGDGVSIGFGWYDEFQVCVNNGTAEVCALHPDDPEVAYVNADLERFIEFLYHAQTVSRLDERVRNDVLHKDGYLNAVAEIRAALADRDPRALNEGSWWTGIVEEFVMI